MVRGCSSVVERLLAKEKVVGSNPIARSDQAAYRRGSERGGRRFCEWSWNAAGHPLAHGDVAKW